MSTMKLTRHKFRLPLGLFVCVVGLLFIVPAIWGSSGVFFYRFADGVAWLLMGFLFCFLPESEFHGGFTRSVLRRALGFLITGAGLFLTGVATFEFFARAHGGLRFYELVGIGPLLLFTGVSFCFDSHDAA
jgi:hypothetical protein